MGGGMGPLIPGRIPWRDVLKWAEYHDLTGDAFAFLDYCIREMDNVYIEYNAATAAKAAT